MEPPATVPRHLSLNSTGLLELADLGEDAHASIVDVLGGLGDAGRLARTSRAFAAAARGRTAPARAVRDAFMSGVDGAGLRSYLKS